MAYASDESGRREVYVRAFPSAEEPKRISINGGDQPRWRGDGKELYFIAAGRATFTIDGNSYDAPAGTYVFVPDPASRRHAVAAEAGTTVLSFGGPPTFEPSAWEWAFQAGPLIHRNPVRARQIIREGLHLHPGSPSLYYNLACLDAIEGQRDSALAALTKAIEIRPEVADWARDDDDFESLRDDRQFRALVDPEPGG
jgi:hypothetical protein